ncbi:unnamed protein product [Prorocentrum cordatum]|uniref:Uncharacterized protein n=1 Tax=Prorocentrum cordatum TaxID=2364126 RepID=A0ABN9QHQ5_9DINO|nr:unnamed protein product [Polarella glacialis]
MRKLGLPAFENFSTRHDGTTKHWTWWKRPDEVLSKADILAQLLLKHHISVADIGDAALHALEEEVYQEEMSVLRVTQSEPPELLRHLQIVKIWITAEILSVPHVLVMRSKMQFGQTAKYSDRPISMRMSSAQTWEQAVTLAVTQRLGLDHKTQGECLVLDPHSYKQTEEVEYSLSYPGLKTVYRIHQVAMQAKDIQKLGQLGLPEGTDFVVIREAMDSIRPGESVKNLTQQASRPDTPAMGKTWSISHRRSLSEVPEGRQSRKEERIVLRFGWQQADDCESFARDLPAFTRRVTSRKTDKEYKRNLVDDPVSQVGSKPLEPDRKRRVPAPVPISVPSRDSWRSSHAVAEVMRGKATDWARAKSAAKRIRDPDYTVGMFFDDCREAFPELQLYQVDSATSSGRSGDDEYQRTVGALFAVFWLLRLHLDGGQSFAYGVSDSWLALSKGSPAPRRSAAEVKQREAFANSVKWSLFEDALVSAGLLKGPPGARVHDEGRVMAMLVLTAIHDVMKVEALLPTVDAKVGSFSGYRRRGRDDQRPRPRAWVHTGARARGAPLLPGAAPAAAGPREVHAVQHGEYNMGWLVQAEAPPGPLFGKFRQVILAGGARPADISFYFVHWLTDLAGAEPCPLEGCEKFVLKFPQRVPSMPVHGSPRRRRWDRLLLHLGRTWTAFGPASRSSDPPRPSCFSSPLLVPPVWEDESGPNLVHIGSRTHSKAGPDQAQIGQRQGPYGLPWNRHQKGPDIVPCLLRLREEAGLPDRKPGLRGLLAVALARPQRAQEGGQGQPRTDAADGHGGGARGRGAGGLPPAARGRPGRPRRGAGQARLSGPAVHPRGEPWPLGGPAFLVYYGPALLQKHAAGGNLYGALLALAEVLRQARGLWPLEEAAAGSSVTVRIDAIKDADLEALVNVPVGQCWALHRTNAKEAAVKKLVLMGEDHSSSMARPKSWT